MNEGIPLGSRVQQAAKASVLNKAPQRNFTFTFLQTQAAFRHCLLPLRTQPRDTPRRNQLRILLKKINLYVIIMSFHTAVKLALLLQE
jgi:hypothetical protein